MKSEPMQLADSLSSKFRNLQRVLNDLSIDAAMAYTTLSLHGENGRVLFNALSRIMAMSDQVHMSLTLMAEDVKTVEEMSMDAATATWRAQFEEDFDNWTHSVPMPGSIVH